MLRTPRRCPSGDTLRHRLIAQTPMNLSEVPTLGLIVPPGAGEVPSDAALLYGERVRFIARGLGIGAVSPVGFNPVIDTVVGKARRCATPARRRSR